MGKSVIINQDKLLMLKETKKDTWECLTKPAKRVKLDTVITFGDGRLKARCYRHFNSL